FFQLSFQRTIKLPHWHRHKIESLESFTDTEQERQVHKKVQKEDLKKNIRKSDGLVSKYRQQDRQTDNAGNRDNMSNVSFYEYLDQFQSGYNRVHPYLSSFVCSLGMLFNLANIVILTRTRMKLCPTNVILTAISICDFCVMTTYLMFSLSQITNFHQSSSSCMFYWAIFVLFHSNASVVLHATSIWLTVLLASIRVYSVRRALRRSLWHCSPRSAARYSVAIFLIALLLDIPTMLSFGIEQRWTTDNATAPNSTEMSFFYVTSISTFAQKNDRLLLKFAFWCNGVSFKVVPCIFQSLLIGMLLHLLRKARFRRKRMSSGAIHRSLRDYDRSTPMLIVLLAAFLIAELPQGLLLVGTAIFKDFRTKIYLKSGAFMDLLSLMNSAVTFVIYTSMSAAFRRLFFAIFIPFFRTSSPYEPT
ncbi:FMRFamide receptor, partial [Trichinella pseudospiralis]